MSTLEWVMSLTEWVMSHTWMRWGVISHIFGTGWRRRLIGSPKLQIIFHKRATKYRALLLKMTCKDKGSYESSPPCIMIHLYVWHSVIHAYDMDAFVCVAWLIHMCDMTHLCVWHDACICVTWLYTYVVSWHMHVCDMTHWGAWHDSFMCVTWLIHVCMRTRMSCWVIWHICGTVSYICLHIHIHTYPSIHIHTCVIICVYIYIYIYIYI